MKTNDKTITVVSEKKDERAEGRAVAGKSGSLFAGLPVRVRTRLAGLAREDMRTMNMELALVARVVLTAVPALATMRSAIEAEFRTFDMEAFDMLEEIALAAIDVQESWQALSEGADGLPQLAAECEALRASLVEDVRSHVRRGHIGADVLAGLKMTIGYWGMAMDVGTLVKAVLAVWPTLQGRTAIEYATIERGAVVSAAMRAAVTKRDERDGDWVARADERQRMFSLLLNTYENAQRAVAYLRFRQQDADEFAPSPYAKRTRRTGKSNEGADEENAGGVAQPVDPKAPVAQGGSAKAPTPVTKREPVIEKGPMLGPDGKPLVPQDDPFAKD